MLRDVPKDLFLFYFCSILRYYQNIMPLIANIGKKSNIIVSQKDNISIIYHS
ncbi:hypothetical protein KL86DYS1_10970 [uncultured Dysgonomonas sp.]|uniref:Uncharacterized protein n=1 Tax=uncultured Dysgonomonas sp. TaxID=206096 RepID=A0A212J2Z9_9BACT|nr:hypothetical protein KL86DYS1_10970 [uncultured Dysgonomonas sp.]